MSDARREIEHALSLDPLSPMLTVDLGFTYYYDRDFAASAKQCEKALAMDLASPQFDNIRSDPQFQNLLRRAGLPV